MDAYSTLKQKHQAEVDNFPMVFAFSNKQFKEAMEKLGLAETDTDKIYSIGAGGYIRKTDSEAMHEMFNRHEKERQEAISGDATGEGYIFDMFAYELANHEYGYTGELAPTLEALGLTYDNVHADKRMLHGLNKARKEQQSA